MDRLYASPHRVVGPSWPDKPGAVQSALAAPHDTLLGFPGLAAQALAGDVAVNVDVLDQGLEAAVVELLADEAEDEQAHGRVVEVLGELVQHVHLGRPHRVLVERVVPDGHDHGVDLVGGVGGGAVRV